VSFAASIAHEVNQPLTAMVISASACLQWLADEKMDVAAARKSANNIIENGHRAGQIIKGIYSLAKKVPSEIRLVDLNYTIQEVLGLMRDELSGKILRFMSNYRKSRLQSRVTGSSCSR